MINCRLTKINYLTLELFVVRDLVVLALVDAALAGSLGATVLVAVVFVTGLAAAAGLFDTVLGALLVAAVVLLIGAFTALATFSSLSKGATLTLLATGFAFLTAFLTILVVVLSIFLSGFTSFFTTFFALATLSFLKS